MNPEIIESIGKLSLGALAIISLTYILYTVLGENGEMVNALTRQVELSERQTQALEKLVEIYSGGDK